MTTIIYILAGVSLIQLMLLAGMNKRIKENEKFIMLIGEVVMKEKMVETMKNLHEGLENLFNPKDEPKKDVKKTRTNSKIK